MFRIRVSIIIDTIVVNNFSRYRETGDERTGAFESLDFA